MNITRLPKRIHALSLATALGAGVFVLPGASAAEAIAINVNACLDSLVNSNFESECPYENLELEIDTIEVRVQSIKDGKATVQLAPLYEGGYVGDASKVYLVMQYYNTSGEMQGSDIYDSSALQIERAQDGSMLLTFDMPQMPQEGYYSISAMDLVTSDTGYGEFVISEGSLVPHAIPVEDDSDEVVVDKKETFHDQPTLDELKALDKLREEEQKKGVAADQKGSKDKVKTEVTPEPSETSNPETHTQKLEQVPGGATASRDTQIYHSSSLNVKYAEVRSDAKTKQVVISSKNLPSNQAGYDLIVVETDMSGNHKGDALSITHISAESIVNGVFEAEVGMPGSLLKTGSVYTAYLVRSDDDEYAEEVVSVRFKVTGEAAADSSTKDEQSRKDTNATITPNTTAGESGSSSSGGASSSRQASSSQSSLGQSTSSAPRSTLDAVSAMSKAKEATAERQRQALQTLAQARTMAPRSVVEPARTGLTAAYSSGSDPASIAAAANSGTYAQGSSHTSSQGSADDLASGGSAKSSAPGNYSGNGNQSAPVNSNVTRVHSYTNADRQDGVKAVASADHASEEVAQHGTAFWVIGGAGLALIVGAAWMAHRRGFLRG